MGHLATTVENLDTDLVTIGEKGADFPQLYLEVTRADLEPEPHLFEFALLAALAVFLLFLHLLVLVFTPVDDFCNGWVGVG